MSTHRAATECCQHGLSLFFYREPFSIFPLSEYRPTVKTKTRDLLFFFFFSVIPEAEKNRERDKDQRETSVINHVVERKRSLSIEKRLMERVTRLKPTETVVRNKWWHAFPEMCRRP